MEEARQLPCTGLTISLRALEPSLRCFTSNPRPNQMNITERSSKDEIITASLELIDDKSARIDHLEQQQVILWALVSFLFCMLLAL